MVIEVANLLAPVSDEAPAGADLSYDPERQQIDLAFENSVSADSVTEDLTDWRVIVDLITSQSMRTKDIGLAVYLCRAGARMGSIETVEAGAQFLAGLLENYWETVHPKLEELGFQGRKGPCESLTHFGDFLRPLRRIVLLRHPRLGEFTVEDFERFANGGPPEDGYGMFRAALEELEEGALIQVLERIDGIKDGIRRTDAVLVANAGDETGTNFATTYETIDAIRRSVAEFAGISSDAESGGSDGAAAGGADTSGGVTSRPVAGRIESREDVARAIDAIIDYYRRREPGSPLPVILARARVWIGADFLAIIKDIAPGSVEDVLRVLTAPHSGEA